MTTIRCNRQDPKEQVCFRQRRSGREATLGNRYGLTYKLHNDLLRHYQKSVRPVKHPSETVVVLLNVFIYQVIKIVSTLGFSGTSL